MTHTNPVTGVAAGVPFIAVPPATSAAVPIVLTWHMMDPPRMEAAFAAALPLQGLDAWRIYLGLPLFGSRTPPGGFEEMRRRQRHWLYGGQVDLPHTTCDDHPAARRSRAGKAR